MNRRTAIVLTVMLACSGLLSAQIGYISTYPDAIIPNPVGLTIDSIGNLYISSDRIRQVNAYTGTITTVAGGGTGGDGGLATDAQLTEPCDVKLDPSGNLYISETCFANAGAGGGGTGGIARIRRVDANTGIITTIAGGANSGFAGDGGPAVNAVVNDHGTGQTTRGHGGFEHI